MWGFHAPSIFLQNINLTHPGWIPMPIIQSLGDPASLDSRTVDCGLPVFEVGATSVGRGAQVASDLFHILDFDALFFHKLHE